MESESKASSIGEMTDEAIERLLAVALTPVDPPDHLYARLERFEQRLERKLDDAAAELSEWELAAIHDPRSWAKPVTALAVGGAAAGALMLLGLRSRRREDASADAVRKLGDALGDAVGEVRREVERSAKRMIS